jgi:hypothetical protein
VSAIPPLEAIDYALAEKSLEEFIEIGWRYIDPADFVPNWHIGAIADHLEAVANGEIRRLIINIPPRHMKSLSVNVAFPPWVWAQKKRSALTGPGVGFLSTSYAQHLSIRDNVKSRRVIESPWYQRGWGNRFRLTSDQNTKIRFENDHGGYRIASSVDGTATGDGGDIIIIDDAISAGDALSQTVRAAANEWFDNTMSTRLNDPKTGAYIVIMQRLHEGDLVGHILEQERLAKLEGGEPEEWTVLCLPARYEPDHKHVWSGDPRKEAGALLWPERMGEKQVKTLETRSAPTAPPASYSKGRRRAMAACSSAMVRNRAGRAGSDRDRVRAWDLAATVATPGTDPDWTVGVKLGKAQTDFSTSLDVIRIRESAAKVESLIKNTASQDSRSVRIRIPQDPGQAGKSQKSSLVRMLAGYAVKARSADRAERDSSDAAQRSGRGRKCQIGESRLE